MQDGLVWKETKGGEATIVVQTHAVEIKFLEVGAQASIFFFSSWIILMCSQLLEKEKGKDNANNKGQTKARGSF